MHIQKSDTQNRAVCGNQRQIYAERGIKSRHGFFYKHFHELHKPRDNQYEDDPVCVGQVREMMDSAIAKASRLGRRPGKKVAKRHLDVTGRIMLYEKDFNL